MKRHSGSQFNLARSRAALANRGTTTMRRTFPAVFIILSIVAAFTAFGVAVNTSWTYQGQLRRSGTAYTGSCNFQFSLWDAASAGTQQGTTLTINSVNVTNGLFTVQLDFGDRFMGDARWLGTSVQCSGDSGFTPLDPRQAITGAPYALGLRPGTSIIGGGDQWALSATGYVGVDGESDVSNGVGIYGHALLANSAGVYGTNRDSAGVWGVSYGAGSAIYGQVTSNGLAGRFDGPVQVNGPVQVSGSLIATSVNTGVYGKTTQSGGTGVFGEALLANSAGVYGINRDSAAVWGYSAGAGSAIYGQNASNGLAGRFDGPVQVNGTLTKSAGSFKIDHPLDPANKFLSHSFVESPDMKNIYDGNITTDTTGSATVTLPTYFAALNRDYRYQLTVLGQFAQAIVSRKIAGNTFEIQTDKPGVEVSWQVTGIRQDAYARENPIVVEEFKPAEEKGKYLYPAGFGAGEDKRIGHLKGPKRESVAPDQLGAANRGQAEGR